jgi:ATP-dependent Clp protease ATP-binding subunit ClpX
MYELPSMENVAMVVVDEAVVKGEARPYIVYAHEQEALPKVGTA